MFLVGEMYVENMFNLSLDSKLTSNIRNDERHTKLYFGCWYHTTDTEATTRWLCCGQQLAATHFGNYLSINVPRWHPLATTVLAEEFAGNYLAASIFKSYLTYKSNKFASHFYDAYMFSLVNSVQYKKKKKYVSKVLTIKKHKILRNKVFTTLPMKLLWNFRRWIDFNGTNCY